MVLDKAVSYRQVGGADASTVYKKQERRKKKEKTTPSIPSKFETVLHVGPREINAFGNRCQRFSTRVESSTVGPGQYWKKSSLIRDMRTCGSVSKKGFGTGFVSKTKRFTNRRELESKVEPGPGNYSHDIRFASRTDFSHAPVTSQFAPSRDPKQITSAVPGPGKYDLSSPRRTRQMRMPSSSFKTNSKRNSHATSDAPAPGTYNVSSPVSKKGPRSSMFTSKTNRLNSLIVPGMISTPGPGS